MGTVRTFVEEDIPQVADLHRRVFHTGETLSLELQRSYRTYLTEIFLRHPWRDQNGIASLVYEETSGEILGFLGVVPRLMSMNGQPVRAAISSQFIVDPARRSTLAAVKLLQTFISGPQDISIADEANDASRKLLESLGGSTALLYSLYWFRILQPAQFLLSRTGGGIPQGVARALLPACRFFDAVSVRLPRNPLRRSEPLVRGDDLGTAELLECLARVTRHCALRPEYNERSLHWLLGVLARAEQWGELRKIAVRDEKGEIAGWYIYIVAPNGLGEVLQVGADDKTIKLVLDHLFDDAARHGAVGPFRAVVRAAIPREIFHVSSPRPLVAATRKKARTGGCDPSRQRLSHPVGRGMEHAFPPDRSVRLPSPEIQHFLSRGPAGASRRRAIGVVIGRKSRMNIIGISGLENSMAFKRRQWPGLDEREYRMSQGHDAAAALIADGVLVAAAAEERFNRKKHSGDFPRGAIEYCLSEAGMKLGEVDEIAHAFDYAPYAAAYSIDPVGAACYREVYSKDALLRSVARHLPGFPLERVQSVNHHLSHAASAYLTSGWDDCLVVVIDGMGEVHSASVYRAGAGRMERIHQISAANSIGILYSLITFHLGFDFNADEYKIMGLAPYGDPERFRSFFEQTVLLSEDGSMQIPILKLNRTREERENHLRTREYLRAHLLPERDPDAEITDAHRDVAAALQACLDRTMLHLCGYFGRKTGHKRLALAGGVALNCTANGRLLSSGLFDDIYVQPAAGDDGAALGAALYRAARTGRVVNERLATPFYGPAHAAAQIDAALDRFAERIAPTRFATLEETCR